MLLASARCLDLERRVAVESHLAQHGCETCQSAGCHAAKNKTIAWWQKTKTKSEKAVLSSLFEAAVGENWEGGTCVAGTLVGLACCLPHETFRMVFDV